jgi:hypothetical protein
MTKKQWDLKQIKSANIKIEMQNSQSTNNNNNCNKY